MPEKTINLSYSYEVPAFYENKDDSFTSFEKLVEVKKQNIIDKAKRQGIKKALKLAAKTANK